MHRSFAIRLLVLLAFIQVLRGLEVAQATSIQLDLGTKGIFNDETVEFNDLNGISLTGQNLTINFTFNGNQFVRLFSITTDFAVSLILRTNSGDAPGFITGVGSLSDKNGNPLLPPRVLGSSSSSNGSMYAGLFPLVPGSGAPDRPFDFFDVHFNLTLPDNSPVQIIGGEFGLFANSGPFGVGPGIPANIVPDGGSTLLLFTIAGFGLFGARQIKLSV